MSFTFVRCRADPRFEDEDWYVRVDRADFKLQERMHQAVTIKMLMKYGPDPRLWNPDGSPKNELAQILSPVNLGSKWLCTLLKLFQNNQHVLVNSNGGMIPAPEIIKAEIVKERFEFPDARPGEVITIAAWADGKHFYLKSSHDRLFIPEKYNTREEAWAAAKIYADESRIRFATTNQLFRKDGD